MIKFSVLSTTIIAFTAVAFGQEAPKDPQPIELKRKEGQVLIYPYAGTQNPRQQLEIYLPAQQSTSALPVIVYIHGGAWRQGSCKAGRKRLAPFVKTGKYIGVSVGYRLSQEAKWPAQLHDCKAAIRWIRSNPELGFDPDRIAVWGTSAGGHLASMLGVTGDIPELESTLGDTKPSSRVTCVVNFFGPSALLRMDDFPSTITHNAADSPESQLIGGPIQENRKKSQSASPVTHVTKDDAPFLHVHGDQDKLVPFNQSQVLDAALDRAGVPSHLITMKDKGHGGFDNPKLDSLVQRFLSLHLLGEPFLLEEQILAPSPQKKS